MFEEHTVPNDNFDGFRRADGGGAPGGVDGRCRPGGAFMVMSKAAANTNMLPYPVLSCWLRLAERR